MVKNLFSINLVKIPIKTEDGRITKKTPKSVSDMGNRYHVACLVFDVSSTSLFAYNTITIMSEAFA